ncbi:TIGR01244 family sulfur transferase [Sphingomonas psychrotolerans]|uniref:TIGR01244 family sulfur transferase n=1 Tax=Sphingomonas psychrotolerans TaxID=1327635 RepID=A0ABU3N7B5_9SPHN|nr:TIGR01244 family sulfur transferase [Sphingomonas psychrotolerans]MDT8760387.1 TIGR01244 family sulfur transferase [Sphingomonas psychrotolerans]
MTQLRRIDETISVAPQIVPEDLPQLAEQGFTLVINNRPDEEEIGQPSSAAIQTAAEAAGLGYVAIPTTMGGMSSKQVEAMADALAGARGPVLAFCRSGTRSCNLWALAEASRGGDPAALTAKAAGAGYDISGIRPLLDALAGRA